MRSILILLTVSISIYANDSKNISKTLDTFYKSGGGKSEVLVSILAKDSHYKKAVDYLENPQFQAVRDVNMSDPEAKTKIEKIIKMKMPDYLKALEEFKISVDKFKNPVSAHSGLTIIKTVYGKNKELKYYNKFSTLLYEQAKNICSSYIDYGDVLSQGIYTKSNKSKALEVYTEGLNNDKCKGWYVNILSGRSVYLKRALGTK